MYSNVLIKNLHLYMYMYMYTSLWEGPSYM